MKKWAWGLTVYFSLSINAMCTFDDDGVTFRTFTSADGKAIEARIQRYDATKDRVFVERKGGQKIWVNPSVFSEKDIAYIKEWVVVDSILSEKKLLISVNECKKMNLEPLRIRGAV